MNDVHNNEDAQDKSAPVEEKPPGNGSGENLRKFMLLKAERASIRIGEILKDLKKPIGVGDICRDVGCVKLTAMKHIIRYIEANQGCGLEITEIGGREIVFLNWEKKVK